MISKTQMRNMSGNASYVRGQEVYQSGKVLDMSVKKTGAYDDIIASVKGSGRNIYEVDISVERENEEIEFCYCECPAYGEYGGICKHCVAVLMKYNEYLNDMANNEVEDDLERIVKGGLTHTIRRDDTIRKGVQMHTTPELASLLQKKAVVKSLPLIQESTYGKVKLEPYFDFDGRNFTGKNDRFKKYPVGNYQRASSENHNNYRS